MGNIISPTPGDFVDRQTILQIKIAKCGMAVTNDKGLQPTAEQALEVSKERTVMRTTLLEKTEIDLQPMVNENELIQQKLEREWFPKLNPKQGDEFDMLLDRLAKINQELWKMEDQARVLRAAPDRFLDTVIRRKAECLDGISTANDMRLEIVKRINLLWGLSSEEKIYA